MQFTKSLHLLLKSPGLYQSLVMIVGNTAATGLSAIALLLLSRILGPEKFSIFGVGFALVMILNRINDLGMNASMVKFIGQETNPNKQRAIFNYISLTKIWVSMAVLGVGAVLTVPITQLLNLDSILLVAISVITSIASTWYEHVLFALQSLHRFVASVLMNAIQSGSKLLMTVIFLVAHQSNFYLLYALYMIIPVIPIVWYRQLFGATFIQVNASVSRVEIDKKAINTMSCHAAIGFIMAGLIENIDVLFLQRYVGEYETGLYAGVSKIAMMVLLIAYSLGNVLNSRVTRYQKRKDIDSFIKKAIIIVIVAGIAFLAYLPFGQLAIVLTVGSEYVAGLTVLHILMAASFLTIATIPFLALFYNFKAEWFFSVSGLIQFGIIFIGNYFFVPLFGVEAAAWSRLMSRIFLFLFSAGVGMFLFYQKFGKNTPT